MGAGAGAGVGTGAGAGALAEASAWGCGRVGDREGWWSHRVLLSQCFGHAFKAFSVRLVLSADVD